MTRPAQPSRAHAGLAALREPPDVAPIVAERERLAASLRAIGLEPLPSAVNFLYVPVDDAPAGS